MNIGQFTRDGKGFTGTLNTLTTRAKLTIETVRNADEGKPAYRVLAGDLEVGAGWDEVSKKDRPYVALKLDDPSFAAPIYARLIELEEGKHSLLWNR